MRHTSGIPVLVAAALLAGCATTNVSSHIDPRAEWSVLTTYNWGPADALPTGDPRLDDNPFFEDCLTGAVDRQLAAHALRGMRAAHRTCACTPTRT